jgi:cobalt-zinc-cadmium efflux system outer membrane protein
MAIRSIRAAACAATLALIGVTSGCSSLPERRGSDAVAQMLTGRGLPAPAWPLPGALQPDGAEPLLASPLTAADAQRVAFMRNAGIRAAYAELGLAQAQVLEARQVLDLKLGYARLGDAAGAGAQVTRSLAVAFADLLLLPARSRLAGAEFERRREDIAHELFMLATQTAGAWYRAVAAAQMATLAESAARASETAGELAQRMHEAGNLSLRELAMAQSQARESRIDALRAGAEAREARSELASILGLAAEDAWSVTTRLPAIPAEDSFPADLLERALVHRLDLSAATREVTALQSARGTARRWRWLGDVEVGVADERDVDGTRLRGPTLELGVPLLHWNRAGVLRATAATEAAQARREALALEVRAGVSLGLARLATAREIATHYHEALVPLQQKLLSATTQNYNYMLVDAFELLRVKREQLAVFGDYLAAVRDYWLARTTLRAVTGGALTDVSPAGDIGIEDLGSKP